MLAAGFTFRMLLQELLTFIHSSLTEWKHKKVEVIWNDETEYSSIFLKCIEYQSLFLSLPILWTKHIFHVSFLLWPLTLLVSLVCWALMSGHYSTLTTLPNFVIALITSSWSAISQSYKDWSWFLLMLPLCLNPCGLMKQANLNEFNGVLQILCFISKEISSQSCLI